MNYEAKFKELKEWEKALLEKEKEVRAIKKRDNPYEYVDFADKFIQTCNPIRNKGINTDPIRLEEPKEKKVVVKPLLADAVTTTLGGIPNHTDTVSEIEVMTPTEYMNAARPKTTMSFKNRPQSSQITGTTYSYNIRNGVIEEEDDPLGMTGISTKSKDLFKTTSTVQLNNFHSPHGLKTTALQRHHQAYKNRQGTQKQHKQPNSIKNRAKTAISMNKRERRKIHTNNLKSIYHQTGEGRPTTEKGVRQGHNLSSSQSRPISQGQTLSKTGTMSTTYKTHKTKYKHSLRNLIKAASTRNHN